MNYKINIYINNGLIVCNVYGLGHNDEIPENYYQSCCSSLLIRSVLASVLVVLVSRLTTLLFWFTLRSLNQACFQQQAAIFSKQALINPVYTTCPVPNWRWTKFRD